ncbi:MAG: DUF2203 domain-containing protein [Armatimonadota bacterium]|nr:DUF2203 domain-containing protein [Armatimonadota bacterium]
MAHYSVHFTISEARATLPDLRRRLNRIRDLLAEIRARESVEGMEQTIIMRGNGKGPILSGSGAHKQEAQRLVEEIADQGIQIKDLERGLVDFPHFLQSDPDHEVFLCWHLGEDTIEFWHEIEAGIAGRRPL